MKCRFVRNGLALSYDKLIKPCCAFKPEWEHTVENTRLDEWHAYPEVDDMDISLAHGEFPKGCIKCKVAEETGRTDSMRLNAESAYSHYGPEDITLEIRPGNTCNFACQTCWPEASSRVSSYYKQAFGTKDIVSERYENFDFLNVIKDRLKDIVLLGGEPFYDKNCLEFLKWCENEDITAKLTMFTNGSMVDWDFIYNYKGELTVVVSLDAYGSVAEYIRIGTVWDRVRENYLRLLNSDNINTRVNITTSVYNFPFVGELVEWLSDDWPEIVTFGSAFQPHLKEPVVPLELRPIIIESMEKAIEKVWVSDIPEHQKHNTKNVLETIIKSLTNSEFDTILYNEFIHFQSKLDATKGVNGEDFHSYFYDFKKFKKMEKTVDF